MSEVASQSISVHFLPITSWEAMDYLKREAAGARRVA
jgi:hypothetical protein